MQKSPDSSESGLFLCSVFGADVVQCGAMLVQIWCNAGADVVQCWCRFGAMLVQICNLHLYLFSETDYKSVPARDGADRVQCGSVIRTK